MRQTPPLTLSYEEQSLAYFYSRTYAAQYSLRIGTIGAVAAGGVPLGLFSPLQAAIWVVAFLVSELAIAHWWGRISPALGAMDAATARRRQAEMIAFVFVSTGTATGPFLLTHAATPAAAAVSILFCAGVIMVIAAQQSMVSRMFFFTAPVPAAALIWNMAALGDQDTWWLLAGLALCFVVNARRLQTSNAVAEARMLKGQVDAERASEAKSAFLATVSHEIRTPLNGVLGMAQAMAADPLEPQQASRLRVIQTSGVALQNLLNDILDMSKIEAGKIELEPAPFDLVATMHAAAEPFLAAAHEKGVDLRIAHATTEGWYLGDANRVRQILANLISNAVKFTPAGEVVVQATLRNQGVQVVVRDTGIGIPTDLRGRIFEKFSQADVSTTRRFGGTGLGLSICRELTDLMDGRISVLSEPGRGSAFTLELPLPSATRPLTVQEAAASEPMEGGGLRVLVAEDNPTNQLVIRSLLSVIDVTPEVAANGADAVEAWRRGTWDVVLMDINMPVLDGAAATRRIRELERAQGLPRTPILALTANVMSHQTADYLAAGMDGHVAKPIVATELFAALSAVTQAATDDVPTRCSA